MTRTLSMFDILMRQLGNTEDPEVELELIEAYKSEIYLKYSDGNFLETGWYIYEPIQHDLNNFDQCSRIYRYLCRTLHISE